MILVSSVCPGGGVQLLCTGLKLFTGTFTTGMLNVSGEKVLAFPTTFFHTLVEKVKAVFFMGTGAYYLGLGFIIGVRYAAIICAGSFLSWFVIVPLLGGFSIDTLHGLNDHPEFTDTTAEQIFKFVPRNIGIGGIFAAGIISVLRMGKVIATALTQALGGLLKSKGSAGTPDRTDGHELFDDSAVGSADSVALWFYSGFRACGHAQSNRLRSAC